VTTSVQVARPRAILALALSLAAIGFCLPTQLIDAQAPAETLESSAPRPLADVVLQLETRFGARITYEDPRWEFAGDLVDVTESVRRDGVRDSQHRVVAPVGRPFRFEIPNRLKYVPTPRPVLLTVVREYGNSGNNGRFSITATGDVFHVIPVARRNRSGTVTPMKSRLASRVRLSPRSRSAQDLIAEVLASVSSRPVR